MQIHLFRGHEVLLMAKIQFTRTEGVKLVRGNPALYILTLKKIVNNPPVSN